MRGWLHRWLWRVGHVWVENPVSLVTFGWRLARSLVFGFAELGSPRGARLVGIGLQQTFKTFFRGVFPVAGLGLALGLGVGTVTSGLGLALRPVFDATVLVVLVRDALPLGLAVFLSARTGSPIAAKLATIPVTHDAPRIVFTARHLQEQVVPHLLAALATSVAFFVILAYASIAGYATGGSLAQLPYAETLSFARRLTDPIGQGVLKAALFGGVVVYVAAALGVQTAERFLARDDTSGDLHYAIWESTVTSVVVCTVLTIVLWQPL